MIPSLQFLKYYSNVRTVPINVFCVLMVVGTDHVDAAKGVRSYWRDEGAGAT